MWHKWLLCGEQPKKIAPAAQKILPCGEENSHIIFNGWGKEFNLVRIYSPAFMYEGVLGSIAQDCILYN